MATFTSIVAKGNTVSFDISDVDLSIVNALRRIILAEVPNVALDFDPLTDNNRDINIITNTGPLHNEFLGHRLSLLPLCFSEDEIESFDPEDYKFVIKVKNTSHDILSVTTKHIEVFDKTGKKYPPAFHARVFPANPITNDHILIVKLRPNLYNKDEGEELHVEFHASKNIAKAHSRWSPVSCCSFFNVVDEKKAETAFQERIQQISTSKDRKVTPEEVSKARIRFDALERYKHFVTNQYGDPCKWTFTIESECAMKPSYIFQKALNILISKVQGFMERMMEGRGISIKCVHPEKFIYDVTVENEDFTLLNVLQSMIYNEEIRPRFTISSLTYIGFYQPHPLDTKMVLKIQFVKEHTDDELRAFLQNSCQQIIAYVQTVADQWKQ